MTETKTDIKNETVEMRFKIDPDFVDPLLADSPLKEKIDQFQEIEIEEVNSYYAIHLGVPVNHHES